MSENRLLAKFCLWSPTLALFLSSDRMRRTFAVSESKVISTEKREEDGQRGGVALQKAKCHPDFNLHNKGSCVSSCCYLLCQLFRKVTDVKTRRDLHDHLL
uniref:Secreted protein n=1 Tax=Chelonoidis abingdonii TaxID=106734 RepID=A0A8C0HI41_CHEAB